MIIFAVKGILMKLDDWFPTGRPNTHQGWIELQNRSMEHQREEARRLVLEGKYTVENMAAEEWTTGLVLNLFGQPSKAAYGQSADPYDVYYYNDLDMQVYIRDGLVIGGLHGANATWDKMFSSKESNIGHAEQQ